MACLLQPFLCKGNLVRFRTIAFLWLVAIFIASNTKAQNGKRSPAPTDKTSVHHELKEPFRLIPPSVPAKRIYVVLDENGYRHNFIVSLLKILRKIKETNSKLSLPEVMIFDERPRGGGQFGPVLTPVEKMYGSIFPVGSRMDPLFCFDWPWEPIGGWIRNWGLFLERNHKPYLLRMASLCGAKSFADTAEELDSVFSSNESDFSFYGGNFREVDLESVVIGNWSKEQNDLARWLKHHWLDVVELDTGWLDQKDVDNLFTVIPSTAGPHFAYASPALAMRLLEKHHSPIRYHKPNRKYDYTKETRGPINPFFGYSSGNYVVQTSVTDFLRTFLEAANRTQQRIDAEIKKLEGHYQLPKDHFIPLPALWGPTSQNTAAELLPNPANALVLTLPLEGSRSQESEVHILTSDTTIPVFNAYIEKALEKLGKVHFLDTWELSSIYGNVNCSTNVFRWPN